MSLDRLLSFSRLLTQFGLVKRAVRIPKTEVWENDVEHSYHLAMMAWYIVDSNKLSLNKDLILKYALIHDLVEVHAGDTYVYSKDIEHVASKKDREHKAALKLQRDIPEFADLHSYIEDYEARKDDESVFLWTLDKLLPILLGYEDGGRTWREQKLSLQILIDKKAPQVALCPEIQKYFDDFIALLRKHEETLFDTDVSESMK